MTIYPVSMATKHVVLAIGVPVVLAMSGCSQFSSKPTVAMSHFGESVREMRTAQTYNPETLTNPAPDPILTRDGRKALSTLNSTYRNDVWEIKSKWTDSYKNGR